MLLGVLRSALPRFFVSKGVMYRLNLSDATTSFVSSSFNVLNEANCESFAPSRRPFRVYFDRS